MNSLNLCKTILMDTPYMKLFLFVRTQPKISDKETENLVTWYKERYETPPPRSQVTASWEEGEEFTGNY